MGLRTEQADAIERDFMNISITVLEKPSDGGFLNFIQLKKSSNNGWSVDAKGELGPYYYNLIELSRNTKYNEKGQKVITLKDAPGGSIGDPTWFYVAVVEIHESCEKYPTVNLFRRCYDRVRVVASRMWKYEPYAEQPYIFKNKPSTIKGMLPTLKDLVNKFSWRTSLCSNTKVEIQ